MKKTTDNKGFSLIELIIVIAIMAVLVAIIAPNLSKYLGSSKKNSDAKNADEVASTIQTCISDFESDPAHGYLLSAGGSATLTWNGNNQCTVSGTSNDGDFQNIINGAITNSTESKETPGAYATGTIALKGADGSEGYSISITIGNAIKTR